MTLFLMTSLVSAKDLGVQGKTFPIKEQSLLEFIQKKVTELWENGVLKRKMEEQAKEAMERLKSPNALSGITPTQKERVFFWDPTLVVKEEIKDHLGNLIHAKGTKINPLNQVSWGKPWIFIDGEDEAQIAYLKNNPDLIPVLVKGKPLALEEDLKRPIYFDQQAKLTSKFGITQVPCLVSQEGKQLKIHEFIPSSENKRLRR